MTDQRELTIPEEAAGLRLDQFLAPALGRSRADVQRKIERGEITLAGKSIVKDFRLVAGAVLQIAADAPATPDIAAVPNPTVVFEDESVLVLNKPSGLVMHPGPGVRERTLVDWLMNNRPALKSVGEDPQRPGIVHRLDREASGLVVIAKTQPAYEFLKSAFQEHRVEKHYLALVHGTVQRETDTIHFPIERSERDGKMAARPIGSQGRDAETTYTVIERLEPFTLLDVTTKTGRTHQVRVHLQAIGHPVAGDPLYHGKERARREPPRLFLHATSLRFPHPARGEQSFRLPLPEDLAAFVQSLRRT